MIIKSETEKKTTHISRSRYLISKDEIFNQLYLLIFFIQSNKI